MNQEDNLMTSSLNENEESQLSPAVSSENEIISEEVCVPQEAQKPVSEHQAPPQHHHPVSAAFLEFSKELKEMGDPEKKLSKTIEYMENALSQAGNPHFKEFWDAKHMCLELFKENINPSVRVTLWAKYSEICREARKLKEIFDEQSAFAAEQIEMAVKSIEDELNAYDVLLEKIPHIHIEHECYALNHNIQQYDQLQRELNLLNAYAMRTNALRKELIKTEMRIKQKNTFFQRLSHIGDIIFPKRKKLIQEMSNLFMQDVEHFIEKTFSHEMKTPELFDAREEIKALQSAAKVFTLNTESFSKTRLRLSECWDSIKDVVKERKKVVHEQKAEFKKHFDELNERLEVIKKAFQEGTSVEETEIKLEEFFHQMRNVMLGKFEIRDLRDKVNELRCEMQAKSQASENVKKQASLQHEREKQDRFEKLKLKLTESASKIEQESLEQSVALYEECTKELASSSFSKAQKQDLDKLARKLKDLLTDKKEKHLMGLSQDQKQTLEDLKLALKDRLEQRAEIKAQLENCRKIQGGSGLDFSQAMQNNELIEQEKDRLEKIEVKIEELEEKIDELQG